MPWLSTMATNVGIVIADGLMIWGAGLAPFLLDPRCPIVILGARPACGSSTSSTSSNTRPGTVSQSLNQRDSALHGSSHL